jgi:hypothetical protein
VQPNTSEIFDETSNTPSYSGNMSAKGAHERSVINLSKVGETVEIDSSPKRSETLRINPLQSSLVNRIV